jgi:anionic cell wall polymer biosynthesis LytR-Cps2A-Psr (LCP) family protein
LTTYADPGAKSPRPRRPVGERPRGKSPKKSTKTKKPRIAPLWTKLSIILGSVVMVSSGLFVVVPKVLAAWAFKDIVQAPILADPPKSIDGPINVLLLGMDQRDGAEAEGAIRADSIIIVHIPATHDKAYLISLPRDAEVDIPAYPKTHFLGQTTKINAAFAMGATKNGAPDSSPEGRTRGAELTAMTVNQLVPGGLNFNAVAILNYDGFLSILQVIDGVDMCVDEEVWSIHYDRNGNKAKYGDLPDGVGKYYPKDCYHMQPWEALDFARQRHLADGDYGRQRHQQQLIKAMITKMTTTGVLTDLSKLQQLQKAAGDLLTLDLGSIAPEEWLYTLRGLRAGDLTMIKTNGGKFTSAGDGNERLSDDSLSLLRAVAGDSVLDFLTQHPDWIAADQ